MAQGSYKRIDGNEADEFKSVCTSCNILHCLADHPHGAAANSGCKLASMITTQQWRATAFYDHDELFK